MRLLGSWEVDYRLRISVWNFAVPLEFHSYLISEYTLLVIHACRNNGDIWLFADPSLRSNQNLRQYFLVHYSGFGVAQLVKLLQRTAMIPHQYL